MALAETCVRLPRGPWEIARRTDALVYPMFASRIHHDRFRVYVEEPFHVARSENEEADILEAIQRFSRLLETHLRRDPAQWAVTEDFWEAHRCG
jgi:lauroyl/myristoyl acyltransferase